jgi:flagellar motor switch protein FliN
MTENPNDPTFPPPGEGEPGEVAPESIDVAPTEGLPDTAADDMAQMMAEDTADETPSDEADIEAQMMAMLDEQPSDPATPAADFAEFSEAGPAADPAALSLLYDLSLPVAVELGRTRMSVQEVLALGRGSVVQLERLAGEPIDVFVGDRRFAEGEVVVLGEHFGIRITRVISGAAPGMAEA